jgi:hypothetical protein
MQFLLYIHGAVSTFNVLHCSLHKVTPHITDYYSDGPFCSSLIFFTFPVAATPPSPLLQDV